MLQAYESLDSETDTTSKTKKVKFYGVIKEIWLLDYTTTEVPMFRVRWAEKVSTDEDNFTHMYTPKKPDVAGKVKNPPRKRCHGF